MTRVLVQAADIHLPVSLSTDVMFESLLGLNPVNQWGAMPNAGMSCAFVCVIVWTGKMGIFCW